MSTEIQNRLSPRNQWKANCKTANTEFVEDLRNDGRFFMIQHFRGADRWERLEDKRFRRHRGTPSGTMVAFTDNNGDLVFGWSCKHKTKDTFIKAAGIYKAFTRALCDVIDQAASIPPQRMQKAYREFQEQAMLEYQEFLDDNSSTNVSE